MITVYQWATCVLDQQDHWLLWWTVRVLELRCEQRGHDTKEHDESPSLSLFSWITPSFLFPVTASSDSYLTNGKIDGVPKSFKASCSSWLENRRHGFGWRVFEATIRPQSANLWPTCSAQVADYSHEVGFSRFYDAYTIIICSTIYISSQLTCNNTNKYTIMRVKYVEERGNRGSANSSVLVFMSFKFCVSNSREVALTRTPAGKYFGKNK